MICANCNRSREAMLADGVEGIEKRCLCQHSWGEPRGVIHPGGRSLMARDAYALYWLWVNYEGGPYVPSKDDVSMAFKFADMSLALERGEDAEPEWWGGEE